MTALTAAGVGHAAVMATLHGACFDKTGETAWDEPAMAELLAMPGALAFIASAGDQPVGFILARLAADEGEIITIGTRPDVRRQGIGESLLTRTIETAASAGATRIFLEVAADNAPALTFYRGRDFKDCGRRKGYYRRTGGPVDAYILVFEIAAGK